MTKHIFVKSYGCQMNVYDSNRIINLFQPKGFQQTSSIEKADLIVLNTCHIREKAAEKVYSDIGRINKIKKNKKNSNKDYNLVVAGCLAQAEGKEIIKRSPSVNYIVGPHSYHKLQDMMDANIEIINDDVWRWEDNIEYVCNYCNELRIKGEPAINNNEFIYTMPSIY